MDGLRVPASRPGNTRCLKCMKPFESPDRCCVRICPKCKRDAERVGLIGERESSTNGVEIYDADED